MCATFCLPLLDHFAWPPGEKTSKHDEGASRIECVVSTEWNCVAILLAKS